MFIYIAHAEADQAAADDLKAFLKSRGKVVETETGTRGFRHLQKSDVVIALWSRKAVFGGQRMLMENRMLDAWADERLVLVRLDHDPLPVGMRDLKAFDASFETGRSMSVWPQVERAANDAINRALVAADEKARMESIHPDGDAIEGPVRVGAAERPQAGSSRARLEAPESFDLPAKRGGAPKALLLLIGLLVLGGGVWALVTGVSGTIRIPSLTAAIGGGGPDYEVSVFHAAFAGAIAGGLVVLLALGLGGSRRTRDAPMISVRAGTRAPPAASVPAPAGPPLASNTLFISYAHADNASVQPVVDVVKGAGRAVWIDKGGIQAGEGWAGEIVRGIKESTGVMVMCSPNAFESDHIKREVYLADRYKKPMLPVFIADAKPPEDFEYFFAGVQWLELFRLPEADRPAAIGRALAAV